MMRLRFKIISVDLTTGCHRHSAVFSVGDLRDLAEIVDPGNPEDVKKSSYELSDLELERICAKFGVVYERGPFKFELSPAHLVDELPYRIHTNRELSMMLEGLKPLAHFSFTQPFAAETFDAESLFEKYVSSGRFLKREYCLITLIRSTKYGDIRGTREILYSLPHEYWRIDAYILVQSLASAHGWNDSIERLIGSLLGYEEWQNNVYMNLLGRQKSVIRAVLEAQAAIMRRLGSLEPAGLQHIVAGAPR